MILFSNFLSCDIMKCFNSYSPFHVLIMMWVVHSTSGLTHDSRVGARGAPKAKPPPSKKKLPTILQELLNLSK